jgi:predicted acylesterase/phospholipase RssA
MKGWNLDKCKSQFKKLAIEAFTPRELHKIPGLGRLSSFIHGSIYKTQPLYRALQHNLGIETFFGGKRVNHSRNRTRIAVTVTGHRGKRAMVVANYNRSERSCSDRTKADPVYSFYRPGNPSQEFKTWEAAAATSAAPPYFKPFWHGSSDRYFYDGGFYNNNPVKITQQERKLLWPDVADRPPDIFLSVGTGQNKRKIDQKLDDALSTDRSNPL